MWSLGCLLYEVVTGQFLFHDPDWIRFFMRVTRHDSSVIPPEREVRSQSYAWHLALAHARAGGGGDEGGVWASFICSLYIIVAVILSSDCDVIGAFACHCLIQAAVAQFPGLLALLEFMLTRDVRRRPTIADVLLRWACTSVATISKLAI